MLPALINFPREKPHGTIVLPSLDELIESFLASYTANTRQAYDRDLRDFARYVFPDEATPSPRLAVDFLIGRGGGAANLVALGYRTSLEARKLSPSTVARRLSALRSVVELAGTIGMVDWTLRVKRPKIEPLRDVRGPGRPGWKRMVDEVSDDTKIDGRGRRKAVRDLAIIRLLHDLMLRRSEAAGLDLENIEFERGLPSSIWILGKGRQQRERLELPKPTATALADWLAERGLRPGPVFVRLDRSDGQDVRLTDRSIARAVTELGERAGLTRHVAPHGLRHESITRAAELGLPLRDIQLAARHKDPRTTQRYIDRQANPQPKISRLISED